MGLCCAAENEGLSEANRLGCQKHSFLRTEKSLFPRRRAVKQRFHTSLFSKWFLGNSFVLRILTM